MGVTDPKLREEEHGGDYDAIVTVGILLAMVLLAVAVTWLVRWLRAPSPAGPAPQPPQPQPQPPILPLVRPPLPPARKFSEDDEPAECSICLEEFEAGDDVRRLRTCGHLFHLICIDQWLEGQATCPLCRGSVV